MIDILIENGALLTAGGWIEIGYLAISGGIISELGPGQASPELRLSAARRISAAGTAVLPGLTNAHTHLSQTLMRGLAAGRPLLPWLDEVIWPLQDNMTLEELSLAAQLGLVENLHSGATHIVDHQKITPNQAFSLAVIHAAQNAGIHLTLARAWADQGSHAEDPRVILEDLDSLFSQFYGNEKVKIASGPLTPLRASAETLQKAHALAQKYGGTTHLHVAETSGEIQRTIEATGKRPVAWLDSLGVLSSGTQLAHCVWVDQNEIQILCNRGATVVHCPVSNAVLGSGMAPVTAMRQAGIPLRLGTDGAASNDTQDCFETMKTALCIGRLRELDPGVLTPGQVLSMATAGKSLSAGAPADLVLVNLDTISSAPVHDLDSALVLTARSGDVDTVIVDGKLVMQDKRVLYLNEADLIKECKRVSVNLLKRAGLN